MLDHYYEIRDWALLIESMEHIHDEAHDPEGQPPKDVVWLCGDAVWEHLQAHYAKLLDGLEGLEVVGGAPRAHPEPMRKEFQGIEVMHDPMAPPKSVRLVPRPPPVWVR